MSANVNELLSDWLDDDEPRSKETEDAIIKGASEEIADSLLIHGLLADVGRRDEEAEAQSLRSVMERIDSENDLNSVTLGRSLEPYRRRRFTLLTSALAIAAAVIVMFMVLGPQQSVSAAMASLEKVLEAAAKPLDRTYLVRVVEEYPRDKKPKNLSQEAWDREAEKQIDGATLFVRGANQYVLNVMLQSGLRRTSGCDAEVSWAFREDGPVHVSTDLSRFRGGVPGQQQDIPFMNLHSHLSQLQRGYDVGLSEQQDSASDGTVLSRLVGVRKSSDVPGPKQIDIWFDANDGTVHKMLLSGLPRGRGGPKSAMLELEDQSELAPNFFSHEAHHEPGRRIRFEDEQR